MLRQLVACRFYGMATIGAESYDLDSRHLALFSERYVVDLAMHMEGRGFRIPFQPNDSAPLPIIDAVQNPDGSVLVRLGDVPGHGQGTIFLLLVWEDGAWTIDDWSNTTVAAGPNDPATPARRRCPGCFGSSPPTTWPLPGNQSPDDELLCRNRRHPHHREPRRVHRFASRSPSLGFATDIAAGHSVDLVVNAPPERTRSTLSSPGSADTLDARLIAPCRSRRRIHPGPPR